MSPSSAPSAGAAPAHPCLQTLRDEHASLGAVLQALCRLLTQEPEQAPGAYFDRLRAMLFYVEEFPERQHHPRESLWLFPRVARKAPHLADTLQRLERDHQGGVAAVRELQHLLLAWEIMGAQRRGAFVAAAERYVQAQREHMRLEDTVVFAAAEACLDASDWRALDAAFAGSTAAAEPGRGRDPAYDRLFARIALGGSFAP